MTIEIEIAMSSNYINTTEYKLLKVRITTNYGFLLTTTLLLIN